MQHDLSMRIEQGADRSGRRRMRGKDGGEGGCNGHARLFLKLDQLSILAYLFKHSICAAACVPLAAGLSPMTGRFAACPFVPEMDETMQQFNVLAILCAPHKARRAVGNADGRLT
ncbi:hypothetical protein D9M72_627140 [compost metagenome]